MSKRAFIDLVRQYAGHTRRKGVSYAEAVAIAYDLYMQSVIESGASDAEQAKERAWADGFMVREYGKFDSNWTGSGAG